MSGGERRDRSVPAQIRYINREWRERSDAPTIGTGESRRANTSYQEVEIFDGRLTPEDFGLETSGFVLVGSVVAFDPEGDRQVYHQRMIDVVCEASGADEGVLMMDQVRTEDQSDFNFAYSRFAHCDYHLDYRERMAADVLARNGRVVSPTATFVWFNTWQPFDHVVEQNALTMLDVRSIEPGDIIDYRYSGYASDKDADKGALVAAPVYNPAHRWVYFSQMTPNEVLLSKQSDGRPGHTTQVAHTSFIDATKPETVAPRRSIETRILAIFN